MQYELSRLFTGLPVILAQMPGTPRMSLVVGMRGGVIREPIAGMAKMAGRLLRKGTERRDAETLARELDERAIDMHELILTDCLLLQAVFLNRELPVVLDMLEDVLLHSTFVDFTKEATKMRGEIAAALDLPADIAQDLLARTLFPDHPYGHTGTRILESMESMSEAQTKAWYRESLDANAMNITLVGDFQADEVLCQLDDAFCDLPARDSETPPPPFTPLRESQFVTQARPDAQQAQVYQGWYAPAIGSELQAALLVMNSLLGGAGLSSRLFTELRDKQGLAYSVRSQYMPMRQAGEFVVSIGTSPENIARVRSGFTEQITRLQQEPITLDELQHAKGRAQGVYVLTHETTSQLSLDQAISHLYGLGPDYSERLLQRIMAVTVADVQTAAQLLTPPSVTAIVAREDALPTE